jgi:glycosyltransferase involved in cell wall biosynthesis
MNANDEPKFSVVVIARNEEKTLPRLIKSLEEFQKRGGEILVMDTGSTDSTVSVATALGCVVHQMVFTRSIGPVSAAGINTKFVVEPDAPVVTVEDRYFPFDDARNTAAALAENKFIAMPDCDEIYTALDIDKINEAIQKGTDQFEYNFVFSHDSEGKPAIQFRHCKFYNRNKLKWTGVVHEVLTPCGPWSPEREYVDFIRLEHWQNPSTDRGQYLTGLALDCHQNPGNDRNAFYFARELMWSGRLNSAAAQFRRHIEMNAWPAERAQSMIFLGDIVLEQETLVMTQLGETVAVQRPRTPLDLYFQAWTIDPHRREALIRIAEFYYREKQPQQTAAFAEAALTVPLNDYYGNRMADYTWYPHEMLYWAYWNMNLPNKSKEHWMRAYKYFPTSSKFLHDSRFFMDLPKVSIVIPHVEGTREVELTRLQHLIKQNANYPTYEVHVEMDFLDPQNRSGCPRTFNRGVSNTDGELVMFLGDDCEPQPDFLIHAVLGHLDFKWKHRLETALTALNDGVWNGALATHWLADRQFAIVRLPRGVFLNELYHHVGCDNELTGFAKKQDCYNYCPEAKIIHRSVDDEVHKKAWDANLVAQDRALLLQRCKAYGLENYVIL